MCAQFGGKGCLYAIRDASCGSAAVPALSKVLAHHDPIMWRRLVATEAWCPT